MYIKVKVKAEQKKELVNKIGTDTYEISVKEKREGGRANKKVIVLLRDTICLDNENVRIRIVSGHTSPSKIISIE